MKNDYNKLIKELYLEPELYIYEFQNYKDDIYFWQKIIDSDGNTFGGKEDYLLKCDGNGNYSLSIQEKEMAKGSYTISNNDITFKDDANIMISLCKLIDDNELDCSKKSQYAFKYIKINND